MEVTQEIVKINTGLEGFDRLLHGGLPKGYSYLVSGEPGTGKTIFCLQYLLEGLKQGEKAIYISIDEQPDHVIIDAQALGWDLSGYLNSGQLQIMDVSQYFNSVSDTKNFDIQQVVSDMLSYVKSNGVTRLAIDPVAPLIFTESAYPNVIAYIRQLIFALEDNIGCTTLLTSYVPVGSEKLSNFGVEEFAASGIISLKLVRQNNKRIRSIGVRKMRRTRIDLTEYSFEILSDRGIVLRQPL